MISISSATAKDIIDTKLLGLCFNDNKKANSTGINVKEKTHPSSP